MNTFFWVLYDFANSLLSAALEGLYFPQWVVIDNKFPDLWFSIVFSGATILLLVTAPFLGAWSDKIGKRMPFLRAFSVAMVIFGVLLGLAASSSLPAQPKVILALIMFFFIQYFYQASLIFYNPLLQQLTSKNTQGKISGIGQMANALGFIVSTGILLLLVQSKFTLFGVPGRHQVFIPATLLFELFAIPMLAQFRETKQKISKVTISVRDLCVQTMWDIRQLVHKQKNVGLFLLAFMLISDAVLTANLFFGIFMEQVYHIPDGQKFMLLTIMFVLVIPSSYVFGRLGDTFGLKKMLVIACTILLTAFFLIAILNSLPLLYVLIVLVGIGWGGYFALARAMLVAISPPAQLGEYFGYYSTFQKFASVMGPLLWGGVTYWLTPYGEIRYRVAIIALVVLMLMGTILLSRVQESKTA